MSEPIEEKLGSVGCGIALIIIFVSISVRIAWEILPKELFGR